MMHHVRLHSVLGRLGGLVFCLLLGVHFSWGQNPDNDPTCSYDSIKFRREKVIGSQTKEGDTARNMAGVIHVCKLVSKLTTIEKTDWRKTPTEMSGEDCCKVVGAKAIEALLLRQKISERIMTVSLQVDGFLSEIDSETAQIRAVHDRLTDQRDASVNHMTVAGILAGAGGTVASAAGVWDTGAASAWSGAGIGAGVLSTLFAALAYHRQGGTSACFPDLRKNPKEKDSCNKPPDEKLCEPEPQSSEPEPQRSGCSPRMLFRVLHFDDSHKNTAGFHSDYDEYVENYLKSSPPPSTLSRRDLLFQRWEHNGTFTAKDIDHLCASNTHPGKLKIDDLTKRANMLADLRTVVSVMNRDLSRLSEMLESPDE